MTLLSGTPGFRRAHVVMAQRRLINLFCLSQFTHSWAKVSTQEPAAEDQGGGFRSVRAFLARIADWELCECGAHDLEAFPLLSALDEDEAELVTSLGFVLR